MGKFTEKIISGIILLILASLFSILVTRGQLLNEKADNAQVQDSVNKIYEYVDKQDKQISDQHNRDIIEIQEGQKIILKHILENKK